MLHIVEFLNLEFFNAVHELRYFYTLTHALMKGVDSIKVAIIIALRLNTLTHCDSVRLSLINISFSIVRSFVKIVTFGNLMLVL